MNYRKGTDSLLTIPWTHQEMIRLEGEFVLPKVLDLVEFNQQNPDHTVTKHRYVTIGEETVDHVWLTYEAYQEEKKVFDAEDGIVFNAYVPPKISVVHLPTESITYEEFVEKYKGQFTLPSHYRLPGSV